MCISISEEEPGPLRSDTEGKNVTKVSRTFSYLKSKMYKKTRVSFQSFFSPKLSTLQLFHDFTIKTTDELTIFSAASFHGPRTFMLNYASASFCSSVMYLHTVVLGAAQCVRDGRQSARTEQSSSQ